MRAVLASALLLLAALFGAPSTASAAGNLLTAAEVSPRSGTVATSFAFRVRYEGKFGTSGVRVAVANRSLPMIRVSGTATNGTWATSASLPGGTWAVTFLATTAQGNAPNLSAGTVTVAGGAAPTPIPTDGRSPDLPGPVVTPPPSPAPAPVTPAPVTPTTAPAAPGPSSPAGSAVPGAQPASSPGPGTPGSGSSGGGSAPPGSSGAGDGAPSVSDGGSGPPASSGQAAPGPGSPTTGSGTSERPPDTIGRGGTRGGLGSLLGWGGPWGGLPAVTAWGAMALALAGGILLLTARRRRTAAAAPATGEHAAAASAAINEVLERRTRRRGRVRLEEDPIVAAMGLGDATERPARRRHPRPASGARTPRDGS